MIKTKHRKFFKHKLLLDEGMPSRNKFPILNERFDVKHIREDLGYVGLKDPQVYQLACDNRRIIITFNEKDFIKLAAKTNLSGVIGLSANMATSQIDKKLTALLVRCTKKELYGKFTSISIETKV